LKDDGYGIFEFPGDTFRYNQITMEKSIFPDIKKPES